MRKVQFYFESLGFSGEDLEKILKAFELRHFNKNDFLVEEGKISRHMGLLEASICSIDASRLDLIVIGRFFVKKINLSKKQPYF
ncbi:hypothetical protein [Runella sp. SP2]|uniref:hypothetical protein n=1 Tax=Runella sp. SP2 TaxID=2268026 RepID=UPI000F07C91B|nr:hypothetical protein [Runella sp. SP2]AYQ31255.1 hypothetical protein DTQ70_03260 [Runella sp. SP2]